MENVITRSKFVNETISIVFDFSDLLQSGEIVSSCTILVSLFTGTDSDPSNILYQLPIITGTKVDQKIRLGVPGVIYEIGFLAIGSLGSHVEKVTNLAILPQDGLAVPSFTYIYEDTCLYPFEFLESLTHTFSWHSGKVLGVYQLEAIIHNFTWLSGITSGDAVSYSNPPESITHTFTWVSGITEGDAVSYSLSDSMENSFAWISGVIEGTSIAYRIPADNINHTFTWVSGTA